MSRKRPSVPGNGDLFERGAYQRSAKPVASRGRRAARPQNGQSARRGADLLGETAAVEVLEPDDLSTDAELLEIGREVPVEPDEPFFDEPFREFEYVGGVHLTNSILWCDADRRHDLCFLSHAHMNLIGKNRRVLATDKTVRILTRKSGKVDALTSPYKRKFTLGPLRLEMHPAGHVLGSAQLLVEREEERRLIFSGDVCTRRGATVEKAAPVPCDVLVIPATYGHPRYRFPEREEVFEEIEQFVDRCLEDHATPVLIANLIGTAQELMRLLGERGYKLRVHGAIYEVAKVYRSLGVSLPGSRRFAGTPARDEVVIFPPILKRGAAIRKLKKSRTAVISGRAVEPGFAFHQRVDEAFPLSDTADHSELHSFIEATGAGSIYLYGDRFVEEFGGELRKKGVRVFPLVEPKQLDLLL